MKVQNKYHDTQVPHLFRTHVDCLEQVNKRQYPTINSNFLSVAGNSPDLCGCYADELIALRQIAADAFELCLQLDSGDPESVNKQTVRDLIMTVSKFVLAQPWLSMASNPVATPVSKADHDLLLI